MGSPMLISTPELAGASGVVLFDCRHDLMDTGKGERLYREGHIPGAHFANIDTDLSGAKSGSNGRHPLPSPQAFTAFLARHGVTEASHLVAYDDVGGQFASRLWWLARWMGLKNVSLLDGGIGKWVAKGRALSRDVPVPTPSALRLREDPTMVWSADEVLNHLDNPAFRLIDARTAERYRGEVEPIDPIAGHIPGAVNRFYKENLNADLTLKPCEILTREFAQLIDGRTTVLHQCGSGVTACMNLFAMEYAGLTGSRLYAGSWSEWIADPSRPTVTKES
jgi:thiosulfate/3-mercaptopyruvate sulfurtransferase